MYWINPKYSPDDFRRDMRRVRDNRIELLRIFIQWEYVEPERNLFDFSLYDTFFRVAEEERIALMPTLLFYLPYHRLVEQARNGCPDDDRRYPCFDRPEIREGAERFAAETVRRFKDSPALKIWNLCNEPTDPFCRCSHSLDEFATWLKRKYQTLDALKDAWAGEYYIFKPILPRSMEELTGGWLKQLFDLQLRGRDTAMRLDSYDFQREHAVAHLASIAALVRKIDPRHETHSNPAAVTVNPLYEGGYSPWELAEVQDSIGGSIHPHGMLPHLEKDPAKYPRVMLSAMDLIRSWADGKDAWIGEYQAGSTFMKKNAYTPRGADISSTLYHALARGLRGVIFWQWQSWRQSSFEPGEFSLRNPSDGGPTERSEAARKFGDFLEKYRPQLSRLKAPRAQAAVLQSMDQFAAGALLDNRWVPPYSHCNAAYAAHQSLLRRGIPCDFITESQLSDKLGQYRLLILPHVRLIATETAAAIADFVRNGGAVWADGRCGYLDKHHFLRDTIPGNGLDKVFGCREIDEVAPFPGDRLVMSNGAEVEAYREIQRFETYDSAEVIASCGTWPAAVRNRYGKGIAELWGTYLTVNNETDLSQLIPTFAARCGVRAPFEVTAGSELQISLSGGEDIRFVAVTSLADESQDAVIELADAGGQLLNDVPAVLNGRELKFTIRPGETLPLLIRSRK